MKNLVSKTFTGGIRYSSDSGLVYSWTWPFAKLKTTNNGLEIKVVVGKKWLHIYLFSLMIRKKEIFISYDQIDFVQRVKYFPFIADGVRIHHHSKEPKNILFWSLREAGEIVELLKSKGIREKMD